MNRETFATIKNLKQLLLSNNNLGVLFDSDILIFPDSITALFLDNNHMKRLSFTNKSMPHLETLVLFENYFSKITKESFELFPRLTLLNLFHCSLVYLDANAFWGNVFLTRLILSDNQLALNFIINYFNPYRKFIHLFPIDIAKLRLDFNRIRSVDNIFGVNMQHVLTLNLSFNDIGEFSDQKRNIMEGPIQISLTVLLMVCCKLKKISENAFQLAPQLQFLDISGNHLTEFRPFKFAYPGYVVQLAYNPIKCSCLMTWLKEGEFSSHYRVLNCIHSLNGKYVPFAMVSKEEFLCNVTDICNSDIKDCTCFTADPNTLAAPTHMFCSNKSIDVFPKLMPSWIKYIYFDGNSLRTFGGQFASTYHYMHLLHLNNNIIYNLESFAFVCFPKIVEINLQNNRIAFIKSHTFDRLHHLTSLDLSLNLIRQIDSGSFTPLYVLNDFYLHSNALKALTTETMNDLDTLDELQLLTLYDNPWSCSCDNATFKNWIQRKISIIQNATGIYCSRNHTPVLNVPDESLLCYDHLRTYVRSEYFLVPLLVVIVLCSLIVVLLIVAYRHRHIIQVLIHDKTGFRFCQTEKENYDLDYDAFIMYDIYGNNFDLEDWINSEFIMQLEPKFKIILPSRDLDLGGVELGQLAASVRKCRRTLIILSKDMERKALDMVTFLFQNASVYRRRIKIFIAFGFYFGMTFITTTSLCSKSTTITLYRILQLKCTSKRQLMISGEN